MIRLRIRYTTWPRPALELCDSPRANCRECDGEGGWTRHYGHWETGEYDGTEAFACTCWNPYLVHRLLPVPRWFARRWLGWREPVYSPEPPF